MHVYDEVAENRWVFNLERKAPIVPVLAERTSDNIDLSILFRKQILDGINLMTSAAVNWDRVVG